MLHFRWKQIIIRYLFFGKSWFPVLFRDFQKIYNQDLIWSQFSNSYQYIETILENLSSCPFILKIRMQNIRRKCAYPKYILIKLNFPGPLYLQFVMMYTYKLICTCSWIFKQIENKTRKRKWRHFNWLLTKRTSNSS